jgi:hypothetical protein
MSKTKYMDYPRPLKVRSGCKVSWYYYDNKTDADKAATAAKHNAALQLDEGFDFGYQAPGSIDQLPPNTRYRESMGLGVEWLDVSNLFEVCIP